MTITLTQPQNKDGKSPPMCVCDPNKGFYGHALTTMTQGETRVMGHGHQVAADPWILCTRCGVPVDVRA